MFEWIYMKLMLIAVNYSKIGLKETKIKIRMSSQKMYKITFFLASRIQMNEILHFEWATYSETLRCACCIGRYQRFRFWHFTLFCVVDAILSSLLLLYILLVSFMIVAVHLYARRHIIVSVWANTFVCVYLSEMNAWTM